MIEKRLFSSRWGTRLQNMMLILIGTAIGLIVAEAGFRVVAYAQDRQKIDDWQQMQQQRAEALTGNVAFGHIIRISRDLRIVYELAPNLSGLFFMGAPLRTNQYGFRGGEYQKMKPDKTVRIVGIGDSVMFGWGVGEQESFLSLVEDKLNKEHGSSRVEVINTAVPGYNTAMEVATLEKKGIEFEPDLVIVSYIGNDMALPNLIVAEEQRSYFGIERSFLLEFLSGEFSDGEKGLSNPFSLAPKARSGMGFETAPEYVPPQYRYMVGKEGVSRAFERLAELRDQHGFRVLVVVTGPVREFLRRLISKLDFQLLEMKPLLMRYVHEHDLDDYFGSELTISADDPHPSAINHRLHAEAILGLLNVEPSLLHR